MSDLTRYPRAFTFSATIASGTQVGEPPTIDARFQEVSGIDPGIEIADTSEGGVNVYAHRRPGAPRHSSLTLKRGHAARASTLARWAEQVTGSTMGGPIESGTLTVILLGAESAPLMTWTFMNAWPVRWDIGTCDAVGDELMIEMLEVAYTTVTRHPAPDPAT